MCNRSGQIVRATAGRDKGELFFVTGQEGEFLLLAQVTDGTAVTIKSFFEVS